VKSRLIAISSTLILATSLVACTVDTEPTTQGFFSGIADGTSSSLSAAMGFTVEGSPAAQYLQNHMALVEALSGEGLLVSPGMTPLFPGWDAIEGETPNPDAEYEVLLCFDGHDAPDVDRDDFCLTFTNLVFEKELLTDFDVSGKPFEHQVVLQYFEAISNIQPEQQLAARAFAEPGSLADAYVIEQAAHAQASLDGGSADTEPQTVISKVGAIAYCFQGWDRPDANEADYCVNYSNFVLNDYRLVNFVAGTSDLEGRLSLGTGEVTTLDGIVDIEFLASYLTISGDLVVIVEMTSLIETLDVPWFATYLGPNGRQVEYSYKDGASTLREGRKGNVVYGFSGAQFGGDLELVFYDDDWNEFEVSIAAR
jgi:hypothetical protein